MARLEKPSANHKTTIESKPNEGGNLPCPPWMPHDDENFGNLRRWKALYAKLEIETCTLYDVFKSDFVATLRSIGGEVWGD